jgi:NTP pyrophosphatase (non-canonical NTP hydrolase)
MIKVYKKAIEKWGVTAQLEMAQEEATELALAVRKFIRKQDGQSFAGMADEIADVEIMIEQIKFIYPEIAGVIEVQKKLKIERLEKRIDNNVF